MPIMKKNTKSTKKRGARKPRTHWRKLRNGGKINPLREEQQRAEDSQRQERAMEDNNAAPTWLQDVEFDDEGQAIAHHNFDDDDDPDNHLRGFDAFYSPVYDRLGHLRDPNNIETNFPMVLNEYVEIMRNEQTMRELQREQRLVNFFMDISRLITHAETDAERELVDRYLLNYRTQNYPLITNAAMGDFISIYRDIMSDIDDEDSYASEQDGGRKSKKSRKTNKSNKTKKRQQSRKKHKIQKKRVTKTKRRVR